MLLEKEECRNAMDVLDEAKKALINKDAAKLRELSDRTIHSSCSYQDAGSITTAVLIYALSKLIERRDYERIGNWDDFVRKFNFVIDRTISALKKNDNESYASNMWEARKILESVSKDFRQYVQEVIRKASINKGARIYEHGISLGQAARLLGISEWELLEYTGQSKIADMKMSDALEIKKRAKMALEFFA